MQGSAMGPDKTVPGGPDMTEQGDPQDSTGAQGGRQEEVCLEAHAPASLPASRELPDFLLHPTCPSHLVQIAEN